MYNLPIDFFAFACYNKGANKERQVWSNGISTRTDPKNTERSTQSKYRKARIRNDDRACTRSRYVALSCGKNG